MGLMLILNGQALCGQGFLVTVSGTVKDIADESPVPFHPVDIFMEGQNYIKTSMTDEGGFFRDSLVVAGDSASWLQFVTMDCNQVPVDTMVTDLFSMIFVELKICTDSIQVPCEADFTAILDTSNTFTGVYHFFDSSTGNIVSWFWDFGDGSISFEQNPIHQYPGQGSYEACLTVSGPGDPAGCQDTKCKTVGVPGYFNFGGFAYLGNFPMNNPENNGDTGMAILYRVYDQQLVQVALNMFQDYGYYWFSGVLEGKYVVRISLTGNSTHHDAYFPTYSGDHLLWENSGTFQIDDSTFFSADIHLQPVPALAGGIGIISGNLVFSQGQDTVPAPEPVVILFDDAGNALRFDEPDPSGYFDFNGIPAGTYLLKADVTGWTSQGSWVTLTENAMSVQGITLTATAEGVFGIEETASGWSIGAAYPNPVREHLNVAVSTTSPADITFSLVGALGSSFDLGYRHVEPGSQVLTLKLPSLPPGLYILSARLDGIGQVFTVKFIK